jgi:4-carboxymuconolactone decarboxylase
MTPSTSPVAVCCPSASRVSVISRAFSIAKPAWSAKVRTKGSPRRNVRAGAARRTTALVFSALHRARSHPAKPEGVMAKSELYEKGMSMRRKLMGDAAVAAASKGVYAEPVMQKFLDVAIENVFGNLWTRPGLDIKTRALICVVSDTCMGREPELALHLRMALRQGWTEEELTEVFLHLSGYIGVPIIRECMQVASKVFKEPRE